MRSSVVRSFRYVATLTAQQIVTSLVAAQLLLGEARETAQRQLDAEKSKKGSKAGLQDHKHSDKSPDKCKERVRPAADVCTAFHDTIMALRSCTWAG
jgi:hypothetical protein